MTGIGLSAVASRAGILRWILCGWLLALPVLGVAQQKRDAENPQGKWEELKGCRLVTNSVLDGDSFKVTHQGREYIFRLYFVDTPETDTSFPDRLHEQAGYFGISITNIVQAGRMAAQFTRKELEGDSFTIVTRWENAKGMSTLARFYSIVLVRRDNLAEELVRGGLARIHGRSANWPDGRRSAKFIDDLNKLKLAAQEKQRGIWDTNKFPRLIGVDTAVPAGKGRKITGAVLNVNAATFEDLQTLPKIGPVLAQRIIANRPYRKADDLLRVPGIGASRRLRNFGGGVNGPQDALGSGTIFWASRSYSSSGGNSTRTLLA